MYRPTKEFSQYLLERETENTTGEVPECAYLEVCYRGKNRPPIIVNFYSRDNDNNAKVITNPFLSVPNEKVPDVLRLINELNRHLLFMEVVMDSKNRIVLSSDIPQKTENALDVCLAMLARMVKTVDEIYPMLAKAAYSSEDIF